MEEEDLDIEFTNETPKDIQRVSKDTVNKILSAQVILNIGIAIKELIENSVDAGSTVIEIKIKEYGKEGFEVSDNGSGIEESNFMGITAKHHTSKLKGFQDLETIQTFGFRGEALSSLCGLSDVIITTRHESSEFGTKLIYNNDGEIIEKSILARNIGTSVFVTDFFKTLPVRKAEFQKNYKKDYNKMIKLLEEYCLVLIGIKIIAYNISKNGTRQTILSTNGQSVVDNIVSIFGAKQSQEVLKIKCPTNDGTEDGIYTQESLFDADMSAHDIKTNEIDNLNQKRFKIEGYISNIDHHCGRTLKDRQFLYVNSRPCEIKSISKLVNEVYRKYNMKHYPFYFINLKVDQSNVDVNLSKDKRQIAICDDKVLLLVMKRSLSLTFGDLPTKFKYASINSVVKKFDKSINESDDDDDDEDDKIAVIPPNSNFGASLKQWKIDPKNPIPKSSLKRKLDASLTDKTPKIDSFMIKSSQDTDVDEEVIHQPKKITLDEDDSFNEKFTPPQITSTQDFSHTISYRPAAHENTLKFELTSPILKESTIKDDNESNNSKILEELQNEDEIEEPALEFLELSFLKTQASSNSSFIKSQELNNSTITQNLDRTASGKIIFDVSRPIQIFKKKINLSMDMIRKDALAEEAASKELKKSSQTKYLKFKERIDPSKNKKAESELETEIKKDMFSQMKVLGQFNLGFIIAQLERDLFIVDQHATDERYNFEQLENSFKLETQHMVIPEKLELTAVQEDIIIDNLHIFEMNGFKFNINHNSLPTQRIQLISRPYSKNHEFGREDIEEMTHLLHDNSTNSICRPSRIRAMLASRACRKSVMIGTALDRKAMMKLLVHMGEIDHPWNCPHGRPTIRFLQNLDFIASREENNENCDD